MDTLFALYTSDIHNSRSTAICHGIFTTKENAIDTAKENDLYNSETNVHVFEVTLDCFQENLF